MSNYNTKLQSNNIDLQTVLETLQTKAIPSGTDTSDATASSENILEGKTAYAGGKKLSGTMPNNGTISQTMDGINTTSVTIPSGYTKGGSVSLDNTIGNEVTTQTDLIAQITAAVDGLPEAGGSGEGNKMISITNIGTDFVYYFDENNHL
jgi:hypothetical protein